MRTAALLALLAAALCLGRAQDSTGTQSASDVNAILKAAIEKAIQNVNAINKGEASLGEDLNPQTQKATGDSIAAQREGDILQEATRILIQEQGEAFLAQITEDNVNAVWAELAETFSRKKRYSSGTSGGSTDGANTAKQNTDVSSTNPLDVNCINRTSTCQRTYPFRSISGWCNHDTQPAVGSTLYKFRRFMGAPKYDDGFNSVRRRSANGGLLPSTRLISNTIFQEATIPSFDSKYAHLLMQYGQFIAHDIVFTPSSVGPNNAALDCTLCSSVNVTSNCAPIEVPSDDKYFPTKTSDGKQSCIRLTRAINGQTGLGARMQINQNSHYMDMSMVYGSSDCVAEEIKGPRGLMKYFEANTRYLPPMAHNDSNCQSAPIFYCFLAGDSRNSLHPGLIPLHTIFLRQHNKWAAQIAQLRPKWSDASIYQETRRLMIAAYQFHVYAEYLPKIIGDKMMKQFGLCVSGLRKTFDPRVDPSISAEFGTAAFRFGHSQVRKELPRANNNNQSLGSYVDLGANIFYTDSLYDTTANVFTMAQGMVNYPAMAVDRQFSFPIRNQLFEIRGKKASGVDLPAVNVQRAREFGVQPYNEVRQKVGLKRLTSFDQLKSEMDAANVDLLKKVYASVDDIDLYVGLLLEKPTDPTALLGPTGSYIIADQFYNFKYGDRFYFESLDNNGALTPQEYQAIRNYPLAQMICENTDGMTQVQSDIFVPSSKKVSCSSFKRFPLDQILYG